MHTQFVIVWFSSPSAASQRFESRGSGLGGQVVWPKWVLGLIRFKVSFGCILLISCLMGSGSCCCRAVAIVHVFTCFVCDLLSKSLYLSVQPGNCNFMTGIQHYSTLHQKNRQWCLMIFQPRMCVTHLEYQPLLIDHWADQYSGKKIDCQWHHYFGWNIA